MKTQLSVVLCALALTAALPAAAADHATILMYHRFGENTVPSTNIRLEQFDAHIAELKSGPYKVMGLPEIVAKLKSGESLPDRAVAITADDAYISAFTEGWPRLKKAGIPFTLFVATEPVTSKLRGYLTWDQIRQMKAEGVTIGAHSHRHPSLPALSPEKAREDLETSRAIFEKELGEQPALFAYPFGEWDARTLALVKSLGYSVAFGQHSGVAHSKHDMFWLPRFPMNESFGSVERVRQALNALPLPVSDVEPADVLIRLGQTTNPPVLRFTVAPGIERLKQMVCYTGEGKAIPPREIGERRYEMRPVDAMKPPRDRISCSVPSSEAGRYRWFGIQFTVLK
ncbi:polysaccharide deacetylase family protein [Ferrovibrio terrae]|uniref:polysaccharide deacetylase family protein n=1 Tax=Ferrovibrio terrae TaxID=2594003 RepID=UPI003137DE47